MAGAAETLERLEGLHLGGGWFVTWIGGVEIVHMDDRMTPVAFDAHLEVQREVIRSTSEPRLVLLDLAAPTAFARAEQLRLASLWQEHEQLVNTNTLACALVTPTLTEAAAISSTLWPSPPSYPKQVCSSIDEALSWLATHKPGLDAADIASRYATRKLQLVAHLTRK